MSIHKERALHRESMYHMISESLGYISMESDVEGAERYEFIGRGKEGLVIAIHGEGAEVRYLVIRAIAKSESYEGHADVAGYAERLAEKESEDE